MKQPVKTNTIDINKGSSILFFLQQNLPIWEKLDLQNLMC